MASPRPPTPPIILNLCEMEASIPIQIQRANYSLAILQQWDPTPYEHQRVAKANLLLSTEHARTSLQALHIAVCDLRKGVMAHYYNKTSMVAADDTRTSWYTIDMALKRQWWQHVGTLSGFKAELTGIELGLPRFRMVPQQIEAPAPHQASAHAPASAPARAIAQTQAPAPAPRRGLPSAPSQASQGQASYSRQAQATHEPYVTEPLAGPSQQRGKSARQPIEVDRSSLLSSPEQSPVLSAGKVPSTSANNSTGKSAA